MLIYQQYLMSVLYCYIILYQTLQVKQHLDITLISNMVENINTYLTRIRRENTPTFLFLIGDVRKLE